MRPLAILTTCLLIGAVTCLEGSIQACAGMADEKYPPEVLKIIDHILAAKQPTERAYDITGFRSLFKQVGVDGLKKLQDHSDDSIALQAAWESVELTVPVQNPGQHLRPDRKQLEWFLSFMEKRCKVKAPSWWISSLLDANANRRYNIWFPAPNPDIYHRAGVDDVRSPLDTTLLRDGLKLTLKVAKESITIPENLFSKWNSGDLMHNISALVNDKRCYVAVHDDCGNFYKLTCIDRSSNKMIWQTEVWGHYWGGSSGRSRGWVSITEQNDRIVIFGQSGIGFHVEAFRSEDGKNLFRVSNGYRRED